MRFNILQRDSYTAKGVRRMYVFVYDHHRRDWEEYRMHRQEPMPYVRFGSLTVESFCSGSHSNVCWSDRRTLESYDALCRAWGAALPVFYGFRRLDEVVHLGQSQHFAGMALDIANGFAAKERELLRNVLFRLRLFDYTEPACLAPTWVHVHNNVDHLACPRGAYPVLQMGDNGPHVFVLQDALTLLGHYVSALTGRFTELLRLGVIRFQKSHALTDHGIVDGGTWTTLMNEVRQYTLTKKHIERLPLRGKSRMLNSNTTKRG